jgi:hypothetical protein
MHTCEREATHGDRACAGTAGTARLEAPCSATPMASSAHDRMSRMAASTFLEAANQIAIRKQLAVTIGFPPPGIRLHDRALEAPLRQAAPAAPRRRR